MVDGFDLWCLHALRGSMCPEAVSTQKATSRGHLIHKSCPNPPHHIILILYILQQNLLETIICLSSLLIRSRPFQVHSLPNNGDEKTKLLLRTSLLSVVGWPWPAGKHPHSCLLTLTPLSSGTGEKRRANARKLAG